MDTLNVQGGYPLTGELKIQGSKNTVLPVMAAAVLYKGVTILTNVPMIQDVYCMIHILEAIGVKIALSGHCLTMDASLVKSGEIPMEDVKRMRSSIMLLGALLGRVGEAVTSYPGGCTIGLRPIDLHLKALEAMGAEIFEDGTKIRASARKLRGAHIRLDFPSVGATENILLAATAAKGVTVIDNAAREPEIIELCLFLQKMGVSVRGAGTSRIRIERKKELRQTSYQITGDRIVAGTYLAAAAVAGGEVRLTGIYTPYMESVLRAFQNCGCDISWGKEEIALRSDRRIRAVPWVKTSPYPGFPTDMQSPFMAMLAYGDGVSMIEERIFESRLNLAAQLAKMGADIRVEENRARVAGQGRLHGALVQAEDLRAGAALAVAAAGAEGMTRIADPGYIKRGYESIDQDLRSLGGRIWW